MFVLSLLFLLLLFLQFISGFNHQQAVFLIFVLELPDFGADCFSITIQLGDVQLDHSLFFKELVEFFAELQPSSFCDGVKILFCSVYLHSVFFCCLLLLMLCLHVAKHFEVDSEPL